MGGGGAGALRTVGVTVAAARRRPGPARVSWGHAPACAQWQRPGGPCRAATPAAGATRLPGVVGNGRRAHGTIKFALKLDAELSEFVDSHRNENVFDRGALLCRTRAAATGPQTTTASC